MVVSLAQSSGSGTQTHKRKIGEVSTTPAKRPPHTGTVDEPSIYARHKAAEERAENLVQGIDATASTPETMTKANITRLTTKGPL